jgi:hypothetical protein
MKEIDINKIQMETEKELRNEDWDKLGDELKNSLGEISVNVNWDDINENLERAKEQISRSRDLIKEEWSRSWKEAMEKSKQATEKAKSELKDLKDFINQLEKDGLLKKNQPYTIELKHGEFIINGKTQPGSVRDKYRNSDRFGKFFEKDQDWKIQSNGKDDEDDDEDGELI